MSKQESGINKPVEGPLKKIVGVIVLLIIIFGLIGIIGEAMSNSSHGTPAASNTPSSSTNTGSNTSAAASAASSTPGLNKAAKDGKFQFTVTGFSCGQAQLSNDNEFETATAQGQFCVLKLNIANIGSEAQQFDDSAQYVYTSDGKQLSYSSEGTMAANPSSSQCEMLPTINPGNNLDCSVAFDVAKGVTPAYAMLHDSSFSGGVKVNLQ